MFNWLSEISGFEVSTIQYIIIISAILLIAFFLLTIRGRSYIPIVNRTRKRGRRLQVKEYIKVDAQRSLVLVQRDNVEHLLLVGGNTDILIEKSIEEPDLTEFESDENDKNIVKKEGILSESGQFTGNSQEISSNLTTTNDNTTISTNISTDSQESAEVENNLEVSADETKTNETDPYKTVEVEMNKLLGGRGNKQS